MIREFIDRVMGRDPSENAAEPREVALSEEETEVLDRVAGEAFADVPEGFFERLEERERGEAREAGEEGGGDEIPNDGAESPVAGDERPGEEGVEADRETGAEPEAPAGRIGDGAEAEGAPEGRAALGERLYSLPYELSQPTKVGKRLWRKRLLPLGGKVFYANRLTGKEEVLHFSKETLARMVENFKANAKGAAVLFTRKHSEEAEDGRGVVRDLFLKEDGDAETDGLYGDIEPSEEGQKIIDNSLGEIETSCAYDPDYVRSADKKRFGPTLFHVALTPRPHVPALGRGLAIRMSQEAEGRSVVDLTGAHFAPPTPRKERDQVSEAVIENKEEAREEVEVTGVTEAREAAAETVELQERLRKLEQLREHEHGEFVRTQTRLRRQGIRKMLHDNYLSQGVPPAKTDAAFVLLAEAEGSDELIHLDNDGNASVKSELPAAKAVLELLEGYKETVRFDERGREMATPTDAGEATHQRVEGIMARDGLDYRSALRKLKSEEGEVSL